MRKENNARQLVVFSQNHSILFETMVQGVVYQNAQGIIFYANPAAEKILGLTKDQMTGRSPVDPRWKAIHEDGTDFPGETHPAMEALKTGKEVRNVVMGVYHPKEGKHRWININAIPQFRCGNQKPYQVYVIFDDITEHKTLEDELSKYHEHLEELVAKRTIELKAANEQLQIEINKRKRVEKDLRESEERYRQIVELAPDVIAVHSKGKIVFINRMGALLYGAASPDELIGKPLMDIVHPDYQEIVKERVRQMLEEGKNAPPLEEKFILSDGTVIDVEVAAAPFTYKGEPAVKLVVRDITRRKQSEEALRLSEERFSKAFSVSPNPMAISTFKEGRYLEVNKSFQRIVGYDHEEVVDRTPTDLNILDTADFVKALETIQEKGEIQNLDAYVRTKYGQLRFGEFFAHVIHAGSQRYILTIFNDITERKLVEQELQESDKRYRTLVEQIPAITYIAALDQKGTNHFISPQVTSMLGFTPSEFKACPGLWQRQLHPDDRERVLTLESSCNTGVDKLILEYRMLARDGRALWFHDEAVIVRDGTGNPLYLQGVMFDITQRKQMEEQLRYREHFLNSIFDSIQDRLSIIDKEFNIMRTNKKTEQAYSLSLVGKKCYKAYHGEDAVCVGCPSVKALESCKPAHAVVPVRDQNGLNTGWLDHYCYPLIDNKTGELMGVIIYARDITERLKLEQEMARMERSHLVGQMAAGIGHEIRNPMTAVRGFIQLLGSKSEYASHKKYFNLMLSELDRGNSIITEYLSLARNKPVDLVEQSLNTILEVLRPLITANATNAGIEIMIETGEIPTLLLNENEIRQLILNLVNNGLEAMNQGGMLTIRTCMNSGEVVLSVQDQGQGIKPELMNKIGTPFFTTKEKGTGLGLAVCYGIANRHKATLKVDTGPGGTTFFIRFQLQN